MIVRHAYKLVKRILFTAFFLSLFILMACADSDSEKKLVADAGADQVAEPRGMVTLDGSASEGPNGFTFSWTYNGVVPEEDINFQNTTTANPTFIPPKTGLYAFTLVTSYKNKTSEDVAYVEVTGALKIGGTLTEDLSLENIEWDPEKPDYIIASDLVVPEDITLSISDYDVVIQVMDDTGIVVQGGLLTNAQGVDNYYQYTEFKAANGWKGILVDGGAINLKEALIEKAGSQAFSEELEPAAVTFSGNSPEIINFRDNRFVDSLSYDVLVVSDVKGVRTFTGNTLSYTVPIKAKIKFMATWNSEAPNILPDDYDYIHLIPSSKTADSVEGIDGFLFTAGKYYIDGDFWAKSLILFSTDAEIYMKENTGILVEDSLFASGNLGEIVIDGLDSRPWKGIAGTQNARLNLRYTTIKNAGSAPVAIGAFDSRVKAAVYFRSKTSLLNNLEYSKIVDSHGYGLYVDSVDHLSLNISESVFENTSQAAVRSTAISANTHFKSGHNNQFILNPAVPAVLVEQDGKQHTSRKTWHPLGNNNYYLIDADVNITDGMYLEAGTHLKFKSGRSLIFNSTLLLNFFEARGTAENPVILDSEAGTQGTWGGLYLRGNFEIDHCHILNGGEFLLPGASEKANVVYAFNGSSDFIRMTNTAIEGSAGYGIVHEFITEPYDFLDPAKNNTFGNNAMGDYLKIEE